MSRNALRIVRAREPGHALRLGKAVCVFAAVLAAGGSAPLVAAELRLRGECRPAGTLVLLGDVAEVHAQDESLAKRLAGVELFPTPGPGQRRFLRLREVLEILELRSVDLAECRLSGANLTIVHGPAPPIPREASPRIAPSPPAPKTEAVVLAVAAARPVERGQVIRPEDVHLVSFPASAANEQRLGEVDLAVGQEATRSFAAGQPLDLRGLRPPRLVHRREPVRVAVIAPGVRLATEGVALEDGAQGDWVLIETAKSTEKIRARVAGVRQVEVTAGGH